MNTPEPELAAPSVPNGLDIRTSQTATCNPLAKNYSFPPATTAQHANPQPHSHCSQPRTSTLNIQWSNSLRSFAETDELLPTIPDRTDFLGRVSHSSPCIQFRGNVVGYNVLYVLLIIM